MIIVVVVLVAEIVAITEICIDTTADNFLLVHQ